MTGIEPVGRRNGELVAICAGEFNLHIPGEGWLSGKAESVCFRAESPTSEQRASEILTGPGYGLAAHYRGFAVLHGSSVELKNCTISLVGPSAVGKSTLAAALCQRGGRLVSDGMTVVHPSTLEIAPGPSRTKLNNESLLLLGLEPTQFPLVHPDSEKRYVPVPGVGHSITSDHRMEPELQVDCQHGRLEFVAAIRPAPIDEIAPRLHTILIVEDALETSIAPIPGAQSLVKIIANTYLVSYLPQSHSPILMQRATSLIQQGIRVKALRRVREPQRILETIEAIEQEAMLGLRAT